MLCKVRNNIGGLHLKDLNKSYILSAYADDVCVIINSTTDIQKLERIVNDFEIMSAAKVNWEKSEALAVGKWKGGLPNLPGGLTWKKDGLKYLGVYVGNEFIVKQNWEGVLEKVEGRLNKWKWLKPQMSFRGRALIINNLVASTLWHRLSCMEPPKGFIPKLQSIILDFFWDKLHWVPQSVLYLPREEGGQGLIHIESRVAAFRLQFIQRYLLTRDVVWKDLASSILKRVSGLGLDTTLFLMDCKLLNLQALPPFYKALVKLWGLFKWKRLETTCSLHWLLEEPLINGARLDVQNDTTPGLNSMAVHY